MEIGLEQAIKSKPFGTKHQIASSKQKFESDDSDGSDLSYQSSLTDQQDSNIGRIQFFKQEMARFFINYPELINKNIIQNSSDKQNESEDQNALRKDRLNRNWQSIAEEILSEAKETAISLESLAKRISLYRYKIDQSDIIDLLLQQKTVILKQIEAQILQKKSQANILGQNQKRQKNTEAAQREDNSYYSWRKRKQFELKLNRNSLQRSESQTICRNTQPEFSEKSKTIKKFNTSLHKVHNNTINQKAQLNKRNIAQNRQDRQINKNIEEEMKNQAKGSRVSTSWRHLINFQPKTEIGRQLSEQIKKNNSPSDDLGIKKTILNFLIRYKEMINNEIINKVTLSQKIQKLYNDDAKELLMFYPSKTNSFDSMPSNPNTFKDNLDDKFLKLLKEINQGPLMKYWQQLQQNKI